LLFLQVLGVPLRFHALAGQLQLDLVADLRHERAEAEVGTLQRRGRLEADSRQIGARVRAHLEHDDIERDRLRHAMQVELAGHLEAILAGALLHLRAAEGRRRKLRNLEKIRRAQMLVERRHAGVQGGQRNRDAHGRTLGMGRVELERALPLADLRGRIREAEVAPAKHALRVIGLDGVRRGVKRGSGKRERCGEDEATDHDQLLWMRSGGRHYVELPSAES